VTADRWSVVVRIETFDLSGGCRAPAPSLQPAISEICPCWPIVEDIKVIGRAHDHEELVELVGELHPEAVIISIRTPIITTMATITAARHLRVEQPELGIVIISDRGNGFALELFEAEHRDLPTSSMSDFRASTPSSPRCTASETVRHSWIRAS